MEEWCEVETIFWLPLEPLSGGWESIRADCIPGLRISVNPDDAEAQVDAATHRFSSSTNLPMLLLAILLSDDATMYNHINYACDVKEELLNVCSRRLNVRASQHTVLDECGSQGKPEA